MIPLDPSAFDWHVPIGLVNLGFLSVWFGLALGAGWVSVRLLKEHVGATRPAT